MIKFNLDVCRRTAWFGTFITALTLTAAAIGDNKQDVTTTAQRLVESARQAELDGNTARHFALLREALRVAPDYQLARWQLGQMQVDGDWMTVEEAQRRAAADPQQSEYRELRKAHGESPQGQLALARWCRKNKLNEEARFHWASVLSVDPANEEALRAVDMRWQDGRLLTREEIAQQKAQLRELNRAIKSWGPAIAKWRRAVSGGDAAKREAALDEIRALTTTAVIPALEQVTLGPRAGEKKHAKESTDISLVVVDALEKMPEQAATESLVRHAVLSAIPEARAAAIERLKPRPQHDYVPHLLSGLAMPIESLFNVITDSDGSVHYRHALYQEGLTADWSMHASHGAWQHFAPDPVTLPGEGGDAMTLRQANRLFLKAQRMGENAARYEREFGAKAVAVEVQVAQRNRATALLNDRIVPVLVQTTGEDFDNPRKWWDWWQTYNEYYSPEERPVYERHYVDVDHHYYPPPTMMSCFAKGTLVWTKTGQQPIETIELGELVLAQNVDTGELTYKPVIGRTVRPPSEILKLSFGGEELRTTRGHPFWVAGVGWRMARELGDAAVLHGVSRSPRVEAVESSGQEEAYNLVVAEFNTYFVGESGVLVHDNTPRRPTRATVPGLASK